MIWENVAFQKFMWQVATLEEVNKKLKDFHFIL